MKKYPFVKQLDLKDCGVASLLMIIKYYNGNTSIEKLRELTHTSKSGVSAYHLIEAAKKIGLDATGYKVDSLYNIKLPCIAHTIVNNSFYHYVVIYEINYEKKYLLIADPADRIKKISFNDFNKIFNNVVLFFKKTKPLPNINEATLKNIIIDILKKYKLLFLKIVIMSLLITLISTVTSFYTESMINNNSLLFKIFYIYFILFILKNILDFIRNNLLINVHKKMSKQLTNEIFASIISLPYRYFKNRTTGEVITRINDLTIINETIIKVIISIVLDLSLMIFSGIFLYKIHKIIFLISFIILMIYLFILKTFNKRINNQLIKVKESKEYINNYTIEKISGFETTKGLGIEKNIIDKYKEINDKYLNNYHKYEKIYNLENLFNNLVSEGGLCLLILICSLLVLKNELILGSLITSSSLFMLFILPVKNIIDLNKDIRDFKISYQRINELFISDKKINKYYNLPFNNIEIKNLCFSYDGINNNLENINLDIKTKDKIMIVGPSGSGKSTILKLLKKYYQVDNKQIIIDNLDINNISIEEINKNIVYISQSEILYTDTLYNNLILNRNVVDKKIFSVLKDTYINFYDKNLKLNTPIEENGFNLSGGERKRIILARSLLNNFKILILDEVFNEIDSDLERKILKNIFKKYCDKTIILVSHRKSNIDLFNKVIYLEKGKIKHLQ